MALNLNTRRGLMLVVSSPSGAGKTSLTRKLQEEDDNIELSISVTTRDKRPEEKDGLHYHFIDKKSFHEMLENDKLLEHANVFGNFYATRKNQVIELIEKGKDVLFDIDWQGASQLRKSMATDVVSVFILPPSAAELMSRLVKRGQDSFDVIKKRIDGAYDEIKHWKEYDYIIINDNLDDAYKELNSILVAERCRIGRSNDNQLYVKQLSNDLKKRL
jgi:guanylate kinase